MFPDWFSLHGSHKGNLTMCWWRSMQSKRGGIREWRKSRSDCVNVSPASLCILTESFSYTDILGKWWAVACKYWLINRCMAGAMNLLTRYINFSRVRASINNGSGQLVRACFWVGTESAPTRPSGLPINGNHPFGYGSIENSLPFRIGQVLSGLSSGSICNTSIVLAFVVW